MAGRRWRFAKARKIAGYTQESLAAELNVDRTTVTRWEAGESEPQPYCWPKLAKLLGVSRNEVGQLFSENGGDTHASPAAAVELLNVDRPVLDRRSMLVGSAAAALVLGDAEALRRELADAVDHAAMSDASLDDWERTIHQYGLAFYYRNPISVLADLTADFAEIRRLLERRRSVLVPTRLTRITAQLAGLMCAAHCRLNQREPTRNWARIAKTLAHEAGDSELHAWVLSREAFSPYNGGDSVEAASVATYAQQVAKRAACPGVACAAALEARVHALHG
ncbi:MAG: helix-turn-helix domain-containing protein, partial [Pseudonocardiaceae bacterium]